MDIASLFGMTFGLFAIILSIIIGNKGDVSAIMDFVDGPSIFIVIGGTASAIMISNPLSELRRLMTVFMKAIRSETVNSYELIEKIVHYSDMARRNGLLSIEHAMDPGDDPFLRRGLRYAVDGMDRDQIRETMESEMMNMNARHEVGKRMFDQMKDFGPAFGMIGTLIGLIGMLKNLSDPKAIGPNMAVALITTMYGTLIANLLGAPIGAKLALRGEEEALNKEIIVQGVLGIQAGENPRALKGRLLVFLAPRLRGEEEEA